MTRIKIYLALIALMTLLAFALWAGNKHPNALTPFETATVHFEQNATDGDVEVVFEAKGGSQGLAKLTVVSPDGRTVIDFTAPDPSTLGMRSFRFESPEPTDVEGLKAAYPEGVYRFTASTSDGVRFSGESSLNHKLPATAAILQPAAGAEGVSIADLQITWTPVSGLAAVLITVEQEELALNVSATLPGSDSHFGVPDGFLLAGKEYKIAIGTMTEEGNTSFVETTFTTAE